MFDQTLVIKKENVDVEVVPYQILKPIKKAKYPVITDVSYVDYF